MTLFAKPVKNLWNQSFLFTVLMTFALSIGSAQTASSQREELQSSQAPSHFIVYTVPKCGSHLLASCLYLLTKKKNQFLPTWPVQSKEDCIAHLQHLGTSHYEMSHERYRPEAWDWWRSLNIRGLFVIRDPRDASISMANWIVKGGVYPEDSTLYKWFITLTHNEQIRWVIKHVNGRGMTQLYQARLGWMMNDNVLTVRFEDLIGPRGGGTEPAQLHTVRRIAHFLDLKVGNETLVHTARHMHGHEDSPTFHKGKMGVWVDIFDEETKTLAKEAFGELLISLGYEDSVNW